MHRNNIQLKKLKLNAQEDDDDAVEDAEVLQSLGSVQSLSTLHTLEISLFNVADCIIVSDGILNLCSSLKFSTHLIIKDHYSDYLGVVFFDILQNLVMREHLVFDSLGLKDKYTLQGRPMILSELNTVYPTWLRSLSLDFYAYSTIVTMENCNIVFQFILKSYTLLNNLKLDGVMSAHGVLNLEFREHTQLKNIEIGIEGCRYYSFQHYPGKHWKNID